MSIADPGPDKRIADARRLISSGRLDDAVGLLSGLLEGNPRSGEAWFLLAAIFGVQRRFDDCIRCGQRAVALLPDDMDAHYNLAQAYLHRRECVAAIPHYLEVVRRRPDHFDAANNLALCYLELKQDDQAARWLRAAHALRPDDKATQFMAAMYRQADVPARAPPEYVRGFFNEFADRFDDHLLRKLRYRTPELLAAIISEKVGERRGIDVLDLGCGTGLMAPWLRPLAAALVGVDVSRKMIERARTRQLYDELHVADILDFVSPAGFDLVVASDVLGYFGECSALFSRVRALLRPGGWFALSTEQLPDDGADWILHDGGRFAHAGRYIRQRAENAALRVAKHSTSILRLESGTPVNGDLWLLEAT